ncbi:MAG: ATP-binding protein [Acidimicrobiales bacterium]
MIGCEFLTTPDASAEYPPEPNSLTRVRAFLRASFTDTIDWPLLDDAVLVASELASNAVRHAHSPYRVDLYRLSQDGVRVEVHDSSDLIPELTTESADEESARGRAAGAPRRPMRAARPCGRS